MTMFNILTHSVHKHCIDEQFIFFSLYHYRLKCVIIIVYVDVACSVKNKICMEIESSHKQKHHKY